MHIPDSIGLASFDDFLSILHPIISIAAQLDTKHPNYWIAIQSKIPELRRFLRSRYTDPLLWDAPFSGPRILVKDYPYFKSLMAPTPQQAGNRLLPLKALLLIGDYTEFYNFHVVFFSDRFTFRPDDLENVANALRKCSDPDWKHFHLLLDHVPEWPNEGVERWRDAFIGSVSKLPRSGRLPRDYPGRYDFLFCLHDIANFVRPDKNVRKDSGNSADSLNPVAPEEVPTSDVVARVAPGGSQFNPVTGREVHTKPGIHTFRKRRSTTEENAEATAPEISTAYPQEGVTFDEPVKAQVIEALEVRYTNYRTAMDNQRLPWAWDCLNPLEVRSLVISLSDPAGSAEKESAQCKLIVWLILLTGQPLSEILNFVLIDQASTTQANGLIQGRFLQRRILLPPQAYTAKPHHSSWLGSHAETVTFELPECVTDLAAALGLQNTSSIACDHARLGTALHLTLDKAEHMARGYLELLRGREFRLLLGRLRKVLSKEIMCVTQSAVLTHLITALPTDAPPSGVYYSAFPIERLQAAYNEAVQRIIRGTP